MIKSYFTIVFMLCYIVAQSQIYDAEVSYYETTIEIRGGRLVKRTSVEININNRAGEKFTKVSIPYSKLYKLSNIKAYLEDYEGRIIKKLKKKDITEKSSISDFSLYEDNFVKEFTLKHNKYPYKIFYSYQVQQNEFLYIDYWLPLISSNIPTYNAKLKLTVPKKYGIKFSAQNIHKTIIDTLENVVNYQWHTTYTDVIEPEIFAPPVNDLLPSVVIIPEEFKFDTKGSFKDWKSYGDWQYKLLQGLNELPESEKNKILALVKDAQNEKEIIRLLYHYLQDETRYVNITIETGGMKPYPASYVAKNKYGDCKALTNYFKSMLDFLGIESYYSKIYAGNPIKKIDQSFPSQQFNHVILYIPSGKENIWLDCTSNGAFGYLGTFTQNRDALVIDKNGSHFVKTPALHASNVTERRNIKIKYRSEVAIAEFHNTYKGEMYENLLHLEKNYNEPEKSRIIESLLLDDEFPLDDYYLSNTNRDSTCYELTFTTHSENIYKHYGDDILISNIPFSLPNFTKAEERKLPLQIDFPIYKTDTLIYDIPAGYTSSNHSVNHSSTNKYGQYEFKITEKIDKIIVMKSLLINRGFYPLSDYKDFYSFYKNVAEIENKTYLSLTN